jgi:hypothetical protein
MPPVSVTMQALNFPEADALPDELLVALGLPDELGLGEPGELLEPQAAASTAITPSAIASLINPRTVSPFGPRRRPRAAADRAGSPEGCAKPRPAPPSGEARTARQETAVAQSRPSK